LHDVQDSLPANIKKERTKTMNKYKVLVFEDEDLGSFAITCSPENQEKIRAFVEKRYPTWAVQCKGMVGVTPLNKVSDSVEDMRELLGDENLRLLSYCSIIHFHKEH